MTNRAALLLLAACALPGGDVLTKDTQASIDSCSAGLQAQPGDACTLKDACTVPNGCLTETLVCAYGVVQTHSTDSSGCAKCTDDGGCAQTGTLCVESLCQPCPDPNCDPKCSIVEMNGCKVCSC